jgi:hypothetical protein
MPYSVKYILMVFQTGFCDLYTSQKMAASSGIICQGVLDAVYGTFGNATQILGHH